MSEPQCLLQFSELQFAIFLYVAVALVYIFPGPVEKEAAKQEMQTREEE